MDKKRILVAEDDEGLRELIKNFLEARGYHVVSTVWNGKEAINFFLDDGEADLVITDLKMPVLDGVTDGIALSRWIKGNLGNIPIILVTGNADDEDICREARKAGVFEIISKPVSVGTLIAVIKMALDPLERREGV